MQGGRAPHPEIPLISFSCLHYGQEGDTMKQNALFILIASLVLVAGLVAAGCTQGSGTDTSQAAAAGNPAAGSDTAAQAPAQAPGGGSASVATAPSGNGGQGAGQSGSYPGAGSGQYQGRGQGGFLNESRLSAAATKLGVSEDALKTALNITATGMNGRPDFSAAAQQLGITQQQLTDALGFPSGVTLGGNHTRDNWTGTPGRGPGGQGTGQGQSQ